jgi:hypothetical protein
VSKSEYDTELGIWTYLASTAIFVSLLVIDQCIPARLWRLVLDPWFSCIQVQPAWGNNVSKLNECLTLPFFNHVTCMTPEIKWHLIFTWRLLGFWTLSIIQYSKEHNVSEIDPVSQTLCT